MILTKNTDCTLQNSVYQPGFRRTSLEVKREAVECIEKHDYMHPKIPVFPRNTEDIHVAI